MQNVTRAQTLALLDMKTAYALDRTPKRELVLVLSQLGVTQFDATNKQGMLSLVRREMRKPREVVDLTASVVTVDAVESAVLAPAKLWDGDNAEVASVYFAELKRLTIAQWDSLHAQWLPPSFDLASAAARLATDIGGLRHGTTGELLAPESRLTIARDVFAHMKRLIADTTAMYYSEQLSVNYETFRRTAFQGMGTLSLQKKQRDAKAVARRKTDVIAIDCTSLLAWAAATLLTLDNRPAGQWKAVSCVLAFVTGRRMAELHMTGGFTAVDAATVRFTGQLKEKHKDNALSIAGYDIPVLVDSALVIAGMQWLADAGKRLDPLKHETRLVNSRYSKELSVEAANVYNRCFAEQYTAHADRFKYHSFRQMYGLCVGRAFRPDSIEQVAYLASVLGHSDSDPSTSVRYQSDFVLTAESAVTLPASQTGV